MKASRSFSKRLSLNVTGRTAVLFLVTLFILGQAAYVILYKMAESATATTLDLNLRELEKVFVDVETTTGSSVWLVEKFHERPDAMIDIAEHMVALDTNIVSCCIGFEPYSYVSDKKYFCPSASYDESGQIRTEFLGSEDFDYHAMNWYIIPKMLGKSYWSDPSFDASGSGRLTTSFSKPLYDTDGQFLGVIKSEVDLHWLTEKLRSISFTENSFTLLVGHNGSFISHPDEGKILGETIFTQALEENDQRTLKLARDMVAGGRGVGSYNYNGQKCFMVYSPLHNGWSGALLCAYRDVFHVATMMNLYTFLAALFGLVLLYFSNKKTISKLSMPITEFAYSALNISQGNFNARIPEVKTEDELKRLSDALKYMEKSINQYIDELRTTTASNERYESELNIASTIQMQMLPKDYPHTPEVDLHASLKPAKEVGGDLYDFYISGRSLFFCVGDVSGKGVPAALYMAITRSAFRFIAGLGLPVEGVVTRINNAFCDGNDSGMFVTMFVGCINLDTLELRYCNAGHNPILIVNPDGSTRYLHAKPNLAAGLFEDFPYQGEELHLEKDSRLLIYTDGVTEAENFVKNLYGEARLEAFARGEDGSESSELFLNHLHDSILAFTDGSPQNDDITMMSIKL